MTIFDVLSMVGGLALFLYGMHVMGEGLAKASGGRLEMLLEKLTNNRFKAVLVGAGVTALIQSSSATTVMVVGFVNSGIMKLSQAIGIIMGANIGTTATSWLLSLSSVDGDSFLVQMLKPSNFSPILAIVAVAFIMFSKSEKKKDVALILIGFAILMTGMDTMSSAVKPLKDVPEFTNILVMFENPILGMLAGALLTAVIQSSSASVGILQALCVTGAIGYATAVPIIMGQNIGTCVTAMISSVGASKNARRTALVHLYFNVIGTAVFMIVFYAINAVVDFAFMSQPVDAAGIAVVHTAFNVAATLVLLPFANKIGKLACFTIKDDEDSLGDVSEIDKNLQMLDPRFLEQPGFAIAQAKLVANEMARTSAKSLNVAMKLLKEYSEDGSLKVARLEAEVDRYEDEIGSYLLKLASKDLSEKDSHELTVMLHSLNDFERIADHALNVKEAADELKEKQLDFSDKAVQELVIFSHAIQEILNNTVELFESDDAKAASRIEPLEETIDMLSAEMKSRHINRLRKGKCTIELGFLISDLTTNYERVADHCSNIAIYMMQEDEEEFDTHAFIEKKKFAGDIDFEAQKMFYQNKFKLPK
ncbi:MAG: Na/Pi cotransporter family protein [Lachnospiraceae bacterium]